MSSVAAESRSDSLPHRTGFPFGEASILRGVNHPSGKLRPARRVAISVRVLVLMRARKHEGSPVRFGRAAPRERANIHFAVSTGASRPLSTRSYVSCTKLPRQGFATGDGRVDSGIRRRAFRGRRRLRNGESPRSPRGSADRRVSSEVQIVQSQGVRTVGEGPVGIRVDFHEEGVAAGRDRGAGQRGDHLALARGRRSAGPRRRGAEPSGSRRRPPGRRSPASGGSPASR